MFGRTRLVGFVLAILFLGLALWRVDIQEVGVTLATANYGYVLPAAFFTLSGYLWRTYRWRWILYPTKSVSVPSLFPVLMVGFMANNVLPARIGEFVRSYVLGREQGISKSLGLATIVLERLFDGIVLVIFLGMLSVFFPLPGWGAEVGWLGTVIFLGAGVGIIVTLQHERVAMRLIDAAVRPLTERQASWVRSKSGFFISGLVALRGRRGVATITALSVAVWLFEAASYFLIIKGFGLPLSPVTAVFAAVFMLVIINMGIMIPSAPGYIGTFQFFGVMALGAFGVRRETALGVTIASHTMQYALVTALGLVFFWRHQLSFRELRKEAVDVE